MTITCQDETGATGVTILFTEINDFRDNFSEEGFCTGIVQAEQNCSMSSGSNETTGEAEGEGASTTGSQCLQQSVFNAMTEVGNENVYGLLHFDSAQCSELRTAC